MNPCRVEPENAALNYSNIESSQKAGPLRNDVRIASALPYLFQVFQANGHCQVDVHDSLAAMYEGYPNLKTIYSLPMLMTLNEQGHTVMRWYSPRTNCGWSVVVKEDCRSQFPNVREVSAQDCIDAQRDSALSSLTVANHSQAVSEAYPSLSPHHAQEVDELQCVGCVSAGPAFSQGCPSAASCLHGCLNHCAGTYMPRGGTIYLSVPKGFNRVGGRSQERHPTPLEVYASNQEREAAFHARGIKDSIAAWVHLDAKGRTLVRWYLPETNQGWTSVTLENCVEHFDNAVRLSEEDIAFMD